MPAIVARHWMIRSWLLIVHSCLKGSFLFVLGVICATALLKPNAVPYGPTLEVFRTTYTHVEGLLSSLTEKPRLAAATSADEIAARRSLAPQAETTGAAPRLADLVQRPTAVQLEQEQPRIGGSATTKTDAIQHKVTHPRTAARHRRHNRSHSIVGAGWRWGEW